MNKRGVSPVIAVVLLIGVAVSMGILVTTWVTHWVSFQITEVGLSCSVDTNYILEAVTFNLTGDELLRIKITNKGAREIYGFSAILDNGTRIVRLNSTSELIAQDNINDTNPLEREESEYIMIMLNETDYDEAFPYFGSTLTEVKILNTVCDSVSAKTNQITKYE